MHLLAAVPGTRRPSLDQRNRIGGRQRPTGETCVVCITTCDLAIFSDISYAVLVAGNLSFRSDASDAPPPGHVAKRAGRTREYLHGQQLRKPPLRLSEIA